MMDLFLESIRNEREYLHLLHDFRDVAKRISPHPLLAAGLGENARGVFLPALLRDLCEETGRGALVVVPDEKAVLCLSGTLPEWGIDTLVYPQRDFMFHSVTASRAYEHERLKVLSRVLSGKFGAVVTTPDALLQFTMPREILEQSTMAVHFGDTVSPEELSRFLIGAGYSRCEQVDGAGQFSVRGGIFDLFPPQMENPVRIEFFGDEIDQMGIFDAMTQRKIEQLDTCLITPAHEILIDDEMRQNLKKIVVAQRRRAKDPGTEQVLAEEFAALDAGMDCPFADKYISAVYSDPMTLIDYFSGDERGYPPVVVQDTDACRERLEGFTFRTLETVKTMIEAGAIAGKYASYAKTKEEFHSIVESVPAVLVNTFSGGWEMKLSGMYTFTAKQTVSYADRFPMLCEDLKHYRNLEYRIVVLTRNEVEQNTIIQNLYDEEIPASKKAPACVADIKPGVPLIVCGMHFDGYELPYSKFIVFSTFPNDSVYTRALQNQSKRKKRKQSAAEKIASYSDLAIGDYVVHENHGIGQYLGIKNIVSSGGTARDYIIIRYAGTDELMIPCDQLDRLTKYIGPRTDSGLVKLSKMGGAEWKKAKTRTKAAAKEMAKRLIVLYAERMRREGFAFAKDDQIQRDFESTFEFEETEAQLQAADEIKRDMEKPVPMDRLLCGDVGYGKTEVALRAAFKAVLSNKQVAILVPTTLLASQHYQTMLARMRGFPVNVGLLSRFRTAAQQEETLRKLKRGEVDIIVGTHRLLSQDVQFRNLGLVIIDEEQRFGVEQKEKLKELSKNVDVLSLSATPIPRTLNMAMSGIRDMSILDEAPGDRVPIQTYVLKYDEAVLLDGIRMELGRGGQVFWLHNRVEDIDQTAGRLRAALPQAQIVAAHGKMEKDALNLIWQDMVNGKIDVLVSTTIIETGVDVPNANTLIIENADHMGLAQLHQIRGRIGRSGRRAYAYLTFPPRLELTEISRKRLNAIREFTEFGAGFKIAMRDLEIRGAGDVLGAEQHGYMDTVGYDLYIKILNEAILEEKGEKVPEKTDCSININIDAYLPEKYISSSAQRIDIYKKIAAVATRGDYDDLYDELCDRYGDVPKPAENLIGISYLRAMASNAALTKIESRNGKLLLFPKTLDFQSWSELARRLEDGKQKTGLTLMMGETPYLVFRCKGETLGALCRLMEDFETICKSETQEDSAS